MYLCCRLQWHKEGTAIRDTHMFHIIRDDFRLAIQLTNDAVGEIWVSERYRQTEHSLEARIITFMYHSLISFQAVFLSLIVMSVGFSSTENAS